MMQMTGDMLLQDHRGFGLIEVMLAMVILAFTILGVMGSYQWADYGVRAAVQGTLALAMAQSRLEAKRAARWSRLLMDDLDGDGIVEVMMRDDGQHPDVSAADGLYTASAEQAGIKLLWTLRADPPGPLMDAGMVSIDVRADYQVAPGRWRQVRLAALRGNPGYVGQR
jgi:prepilin-type N-terminal cleavage/methylation domain-containing protein